jgi:hypothetical protein
MDGPPRIHDEQLEGSVWSMLRRVEFDKFGITGIPPEKALDGFKLETDKRHAILHLLRNLMHRPTFQNRTAPPDHNWRCCSSQSSLRQT